MPGNCVTVQSFKLHSLCRTRWWACRLMLLLMTVCNTRLSTIR